LFHTGEGGAIFCNDPDLRHKIYYTHNFGHNGPEDFYGLGINAKISELQAAMGLAVLPYISYIRSTRDSLIEKYEKKLPFDKLKRMQIRKNTDWNASYYPIIFESENTLLTVLNALKSENIYPRRYFYPSLNLINYVKKNNTMEVSEKVSTRILCLPLYKGLSEKDVQLICKIITSFV
jgi:dTDP-4-amino-4,6-dideoxygalactose transaminase